MPILYTKCITQMHICFWQYNFFTEVDELKKNNLADA